MRSIILNFSLLFRLERLLSAIIKLILLFVNLTHPDHSQVSYFDANPPCALVTSEQLESIVDVQSWFELHGMITGTIFLLDSAPGVRVSDFPKELHETTVFEYQREYIFNTCTLGFSEMKAGVYGSPIVHQPEPKSERDGIVPGFYFLDDGVRAIVPNLDQFLAAG